MRPNGVAAKLRNVIGEVVALEEEFGAAAFRTQRDHFGDAEVDIENLIGFEGALGYGPERPGGAGDFPEVGVTAGVGAESIDERHLATDIAIANILAQATRTVVGDVAVAIEIESG